ILDKRDLVLGKRPRFLAIDDHCAQQDVVLEQPHCNLAAGTPHIDLLSESRVGAINFFFAEIGNMDDSFAATDSPQRGLWSRPNGTYLPHPLNVVRLTAVCRWMKGFAVISKKVTMRRFAKPYCLVEHGLEDRGEVTRRGVNDLQHLGGRGLLVQGFARLG